MSKHVLSMMALAATAVSAGYAADRPEGFRFRDNRLTIKPYVSLSYTYDSNVDTMNNSEDESIFCVEPGADFTWKGDRWNLTGSIFYRYDAHTEYSKELGSHSFGEALNYAWSNVGGDGKGWNLTLNERYQFISQEDAIGRGDGRGIWRDREVVDVGGALERRFTDRLHGSVMGQYDWIDYKNDTGKYAPLYGNSSYSAGIEAGYVFTPWTDALIDGGYTHYNQKQGSGESKHYNDRSETWTLQAGIGSHATERISYRALAGASWMDYGGHSGTECGWTYTLSANWRITRQLQFSALGSSYYQPSERSLGQAVKVYSLSGGLSYLTFGDHMTFTFDLAYRKEDNVYNDSYLAAGNDFGEDILTARLGANYTINRWVSVYANISYEEEWADGSNSSNYDYDRYTGTVGMRFHY